MGVNIFCPRDIRNGLNEVLDLVLCDRSDPFSVILRNPGFLCGNITEHYPDPHSNVVKHNCSRIEGRKDFTNDLLAFPFDGNGNIVASGQLSMRTSPPCASLTSVEGMKRSREEQIERRQKSAKFFCSKIPSKFCSVVADPRQFR